MLPVQALLDAGATLMGTTHMDELAYSLNGENVHYGTPPNPACPDRIPGGSSSGSAVSHSIICSYFGQQTCCQAQTSCSVATGIHLRCYMHGMLRRVIRCGIEPCLGSRNGGDGHTESPSAECRSLWVMALWILPWAATQGAVCASPPASAASWGCAPPGAGCPCRAHAPWQRPSTQVSGHVCTTLCPGSSSPDCAQPKLIWLLPFCLMILELSHGSLQELLRTKTTLLQHTP